MNAPDPGRVVRLPIEGIYAIVNADELSAAAALERLEALVRGGTRVVQLRFKRADPRHRRTLASTLGARGPRLGVPLIINDDVELACADLEGLWGLHVGQQDLAGLGPDPRAAVDALRRRLSSRGRGLGVSTHNLDQVRAAIALAPDYIGFGPVFTTRSKPDAAAVTGLEALRAACKLFPGPVVAIGGITTDRAGKVRDAGAAAVAAISALQGRDPSASEQRARAMSRAWGPPAARDNQAAVDLDISGDD